LLPTIPQIEEQLQTTKQHGTCKGYKEELLTVSAEKHAQSPVHDPEVVLSESDPGGGGAGDAVVVETGTASRGR
jgi:microcompartment protein CcmK/EutM